MKFRALLAACLPLLGSCGTIKFYTQAVQGQAEISFGKKPISTVLADPETEAELAKKLKVAQRIVDFAEQELSLPHSGCYQDYNDLGREHVVHIVHGARELSFEAKTWWYPFVGKQDYQGYFKEADAIALCEQLEQEGYETFRGGVNAYSTLGFFNDPLLNTFIHYPEAKLAELIFHELTHHRFFTKGNTPFNEALAEAVSREGTRRYLQTYSTETQQKKYELRLQRRSQIREEIENTISRLEATYESSHSNEKKRKLKARELSELRTSIKKLFQGWEQTPQNFLSTPLNNARLNAFTTYERLVPPLQDILKNRFKGDIDAFLSTVEKEGADIIPSP